MVTDRRTKALAPGSVATLESAERAPLATVAVNPGSTIMARVLDRDPEAAIDGEWLRARIEAAAAHRARLYDAPFHRLVHAEGDGLPGLVIDRFGDALSIQPNAAWADGLIDELVGAAVAATGASTVVVNASGRSRAIEGLGDESRVAVGEVAGPVPTPMNGATYMADLIGGQKTGLFFDQRPNHAFAARLAEGAEVLDVFSHVGGFALACLAAGAVSALAVDSSAPALALAEEGATATGVADRFETRRGQAFDVMRALSQDGRRFGLVVSDPPAFAPTKGAVEKGLRAYETAARLAAGLT
ncbi:MAG: class I SAM-dependent methyltransferase, partial [Pseudomonadota bacterium]